MGNCSHELFVWAVSGGFLISTGKNVGAVSFMQIDLFLHKFLTALKRFPKHKLIFMRTDLFSLNDKNSCTAHRIELCRHFNSKLLWWQFWMFFNQKFAFQNKNVGAVSFIQFELFLAYKSDTSRTHQDIVRPSIADTLFWTAVSAVLCLTNHEPPDCTSNS